ncbi:reverse transcriptase [Senna tora]|uniref:Reverse transcriptase n=1 Tax=Senna tora TaxID=362788 RepID=A0A834T5M7_9FABA|nr:reverse transcriptase [Senna tora]
MPPKIAFQNASAKAVEFIHLSNTGGHISNMKNIEVCWSPPLEGFFKLNVDGSCMGNSGMMAAIGVIRNHLGHWISGFSKFIGPGSRLAGYSYLNSNTARLSMCIARRTNVLIYLMGITHSRRSRGTYNPG